MASKGAPHLTSTFVRLRGDGSAEPLPVDDSFWQRLASGQLGTFRDEYLVSCYTFDTDWTSWEMHPEGDEIVCLLSGSVTFVLEEERGNREIVLDRPNAFTIVPRGTWHTAKVHEPSSMLFITPGEDTQHRGVEEVNA